VALAEKHRSSIYQHLSPIVGEEAAEALLAQFPSRDVDEPITRAYLDQRFAEARLEVHAEITSLHTEIGGLSTELHTEIAELRTELNRAIGGVQLQAEEVSGSLRTDLNRAIGGVQLQAEEVSGSLRTEMRDLHAQTIRWTVGTGIAVAGVIVGAMNLVG